ncbi:tyrosine-type recombinase/integrase [Serratia quinivorans]|uniref:tyrosine-type recombinase/integrase n=1 Tax=Serratia quinivorans TaxID=137545 RepID=UPI0021BD10AE|nr:tyrosine-type recombinase/integrase [Serratia quinivorans]
MRHTSACAIPNTILRGKNYYLHFRLPENKFFRASLSCDSATRTRYIVARLGLFISLVKSARMEVGQLLDIIKEMKKLEQEDIDNYLLEVQTVFYTAAKNIPAEIRASLRKSMPLSAEKANVSAMSSMLGTTFLNDAPALLEDTVIEQLSSRYDISGKETEIDGIAAECDLLWKQVCDAKTAFLHSDHFKYGQILASLKPDIIPASPPVQREDTPSPVVETPTLLEAWAAFVKYKSHWNDKVRQINEKYFEAIAIVIGKDTPVAEVSKQDIKRLLEAVEGLPKQNKRPYNKMTVQECLELDDIPEDDLVSPKTVKDYLKLCQSFFSAFLTKEKDILRSSPTDNVPFVFKSKPYGDYSDTEMRSLVDKFSSETNWKKWVFLLLAYTGARRAEITKLTSKDVLFDGDTGRYYLMINESKTAAGTRQIPLHNYLINNGFIDFVKSKGDSALFPEITYQNQVTKAFHNIRDELGIPYLNDFNEPRIVHSLRHTFITSAMTNSNTTLVQQVVGHEQSNIGETKRYVHRVKLSALLRVVDNIDWL